MGGDRPNATVLPIWYFLVYIDNLTHTVGNLHYTSVITTPIPPPPHPTIQCRKH
jgi:hypothetical protein